MAAITITSPEQVLVLRYLTEKARAKERHDKAAAALDALRQHHLGEVITLADGRRFEVVDNFAADVVKKMTFFDRYELRQVR